MLALLAPGQGAQTPGFLDPWLSLPGAPEALTEWSVMSGVDLRWAGVAANADEIRDTAIAQPLLVAAGALAIKALDAVAPAVTVGHSVGELTAAIAARALTPGAGVTLAAARGRAMSKAAGDQGSGMTAILGGDPALVTAHVRRFGLDIANFNGEGQLVAAGPLDALAHLAADPPVGTRLRPLAVAGAFHTKLMASAQAEFANAVAETTIADPTLPIVSNLDGAIVRSGRELSARLLEQVCAPVRFDRCLRTLGSAGVTAAIELPPAGTLSALIRRALPDVEVVALRTPDDLPTAFGLAVRNAPLDAEPEPPLRLVVAPQSGTVNLIALPAGARVTPGTAMGTVRAPRTEAPVSASVSGVLTEWLVHDGDLVRTGQPVALLELDEERS